MKEPFDKLWDMVVKFQSFYEKWMNGPILTVNPEEVDEQVRSLILRDHTFSCVLIDNFFRSNRCGN